MKKIVLGTTSPQPSKRERQHHELAREAAREGIVLLKNEGMLPLKCKKLALYGSGARQTVAGGTGSGAMHPRHIVGIEEGLEAAGVTASKKRSPPSPIFTASSASSRTTALSIPRASPWRKAI